MFEGFEEKVLIFDFGSSHYRTVSKLCVDFDAQAKRTKPDAWAPRRKLLRILCEYTLEVGDKCVICVVTKASGPQHPNCRSSRQWVCASPLSIATGLPTTLALVL